MPFEYAVRPFQSPDTHGRIIIPSTPGETPQRATLTWGAKTALNNIQPANSGINVECCKDTKSQKSAEMNQVSVGIEGPPTTVAGSMEILFKRTSVAKFDKTQKDECASDWDQMSYVAAGIKQAFADLEGDIQAGGAGKTVDHCKATSNFTYQVN